MHWLQPVIVFAPTAWGATLAGFMDLDPIKSQAEQNGSCQLPPGFVIKDFTGKSNDTGSTISSFDFIFQDDTTDVTTQCQFNASSESTTPGGMQKRYACNDGQTKFIWDDHDDQLWMIERVCNTDSGSPQYETAGSVLMHLNCEKQTQNCASNATQVSAKFTSISPIRDPTLRQARQSLDG